MEYFFIFLFSMSVISNPVIGMLIFLADREPCATERTYQLLKAELFLLLIPLLPLCGIPFSYSLSTPSFLKAMFVVWSLGVFLSSIKTIRQIHYFRKHVLAHLLPVHDQNLLPLSPLSNRNALSQPESLYTITTQSPLPPWWS